MAMRELIIDRDNEEEEEVWVAHYSSNHQILLVGEGDFSFSHSLATSFGSASNICASSLDSYDEVVRKYKNARSNLNTLKRLGAFLLHGVDATKLQFHHRLRFRRFDRVIFNFPHAGFHSKESDSYLIQKHRELVFGFFHGASHMLRADGHIHVSHKNKAPFCHWNLEELASRCFLVLIQRVAFEKSKYPGYENKRGDGSRCDQPFLLGDCSTFKFRFCRVAKELYAEKLKWRQVKERESKCPQAFSNKQPVSSDLSYRQDHNLRQVVEDPLVQSRHRTYPLDLSYYQEHRRSQFEDAKRPVSFALERNHALFQDNSIQLDKVGFTGRINLICQGFSSKTNHPRQEQFNDCCKRFNGVSHGIYNGERRRMLTRTSFSHPYTRESHKKTKKQSLSRQSNLNVQTLKHW